MVIAQERKFAKEPLPWWLGTPEPGRPNTEWTEFMKKIINIKKFIKINIKSKIKMQQKRIEVGLVKLDELVMMKILKHYKEYNIISSIFCFLFIVRCGIKKDYRTFARVLYQGWDTVIDVRVYPQGYRINKKSIKKPTPLTFIITLWMKIS